MPMPSKRVEHIECSNIIADSIRNIIRRSMNEHFRDRCFEILEVNNSFEAGEKLKTSITAVLENYTHNKEIKSRKGISCGESVRISFERGSFDIDVEEIDGWN